MADEQRPVFRTMRERLDFERQRRLNAGKIAEAPPSSSLSTDEPDNGKQQKPLDAIILSVDPNGLADAIDLDPDSAVLRPSMDSTQRRYFWWLIGAYLLIAAMAVATQYALFAFLSVVVFFLLLRIGLSVLPTNRKIGVMLIGSALLITCVTLYAQHLAKPPEVERQEESDGGAYRRSLDKGGNQGSTCPHCKGLGIRQNQVTGEIGQCSSCGGDGKVSAEQWEHLSKE